MTVTFIVIKNVSEKNTMLQSSMVNLGVKIYIN